MSPKSRRHKLLLDEMLMDRKNFPRLNKLHDLKHIVFDFKQSGIDDEKVVQTAKKEIRILISRNQKHMRKLCERSEVFLITITEKIPYEEVDSRIVAFLKKPDFSKKELILRKSPRNKQSL